MAKLLTPLGDLYGQLYETPAQEAYIGDAVTTRKDVTSKVVNDIDATSVTTSREFSDPRVDHCSAVN